MNECVESGEGQYSRRRSWKGAYKWHFLGFGHYLEESGISPADFGASVKHKLYTEASRERDHPRNRNMRACMEKER